jgi:hypothetical protein
LWANHPTKTTDEANSLSLVNEDAIPRYPKNPVHFNDLFAAILSCGTK